MTNHSRRDFEAKIIAHAWKDPQFKKQLLSNPRAALKEFHYNLPENYQCKVVEETENQWILVLPPSPAEAAKLSESQLLSFAAGATPDTNQECPTLNSFCKVSTTEIPTCGQ